MGLLAQLVDENRGPELAAIVQAPSALTGLSDNQRGVFEQAITGKHAAAELEERDQLTGALEIVTAAAGAAGSLVKGLTDPAKIAEIERGAAEADAAGAAFDQSVQ